MWILIINHLITSKLLYLFHCYMYLLYIGAYQSINGDDDQGLPLLDEGTNRRNRHCKKVF